MDHRPRILSRMSPALRRLLRLEGQHAVTLLFFGAWLMDSPPRANLLPVWQPFTWALPMVIIGLCQTAVILMGWHRGRVIAGMCNVLIWVAVVVGLVLRDSTSFDVAVFGTFAFFAFWAFIAESFGAPKL